MARPILRFATRFTRRTRMTAWAIAFAAMVLVGALSLADGLTNGIETVTDRVRSGPNLYIRGAELLESEIDPAGVAAIPGTFVAMRAHTGELVVNGLIVFIVVIALENYDSGVGTTPFPSGGNNLSLDVGLRARIEAMSGAPTPSSGLLDLLGLRLDLPIVPAPPSRSDLFPDDWAYVRADLLQAINPDRGSPIQAILADGALDPSVIRDLGLTRLEAIGAIGFVRGSVAQVQSSLRILAIVIGVVIGLLVYAAMSLEVHQRAREIAILRSLGASPATVAGVYEVQALLLALAGAILGCALGIVAAHGVVSFAPLVGLPSLVILAPPVGAVVLALSVALVAALFAGVVPSRRAAVLIKSKGAVSS